MPAAYHKARAGGNFPTDVQDFAPLRGVIRIFITLARASGFPDAGRATHARVAGDSHNARAGLATVTEKHHRVASMALLLCGGGFPMKLRLVLMLSLAAITGCFYPPQQKPLPQRSTEVTVPIAYDLAWDAVHSVISSNGYQIIRENPDQGIVEAQAVGAFTLKDADCGKLKGVAGKYRAEPDPDASAVYDFQVKPEGTGASTVGIEATFSAPLHIPMHRVSDEQCVSRGIQEGRLLTEISQQAAQEHRPEFKPSRPPQ